ncbi:MAG: Na+:solute symporter [Planctomycetes bacterium]|nr:Na+:solute symporter [Planctomycetota bacterium]
MQLEGLDWAFVIAFFVVALTVGLLVARRAGRSTSEFFLSGRTMPWWLLGMSIVATTFSTDTPNLVTDIVRQNGVAGNWVWWAFLLTGMLTVFVYARLWRRSGVTTDVEFYELRYSGKPAAFLRGFRALYLGVFFNICIMAAVSLAAIKIGRVMLGFTPIQTILIASLVTVIFSALGGLRAVLFTDFLLFIVAMIGAFAAAVIALKQPDVGGLSGMLSSEHLQGKLSILPVLANPDGSSNLDTVAAILIIPLAVQWWSVWYPGAEPGGGGYIAQRMLSAKDESHAVGATLFFNSAHYALRPWPWIIVALCSLIVFPFDSKPDQQAAADALQSEELKPLVVKWEADSTSVDEETGDRIEALKIQEKGLTAIKAAFPETEYGKLGHDLAYPAMLTFLPRGLLGLVVASLIAAYMSTISTHLNWGSSYVVNDFWKRFINRDAGDREQVWVGRASTVLLMVIAGTLALWLENALQAFHILLQIGAGTGLLFILRWFWWRINPYSELTAMIVSFFVALYMQFWAPESLEGWQKLIIGVGITTVCWIIVTLVTPAASKQTLRSFYRLIRPGGPGWRKVMEEAERDGETITGPEGGRSNLPLGIVCMVAGCFAVYSALFGTGYWIYGNTSLGMIFSAVFVISGFVLIMLMTTMRKGELAQHAAGIRCPNPQCSTMNESQATSCARCGAPLASAVEPGD